MKNDLLEDRKEDWLAQEYRRENLRNNLDLDDAKKLKDEHYKKHEGKEPKVNSLNIIDFVLTLLVFIFIFLFLENIIYILNLRFY